MVSRREFLRKLAACGPAAAAAGLALGGPPTSRPSRAAEEAAPSGPETLEGILRTAPRARFWTSTKLEGENCTTCHQRKKPRAHGDFEHPENLVHCLLCAQRCMLEDGERGKCRARLNVAGELRSLVYGRPLSVHVDPIEKKPFYHFLPGSNAFSLSTSGCPLRCKFCQNWQISQAKPEEYKTRFMPPQEIVDATLTSKAPMIAFTYNEPTVFAEYLLDIAKLARPKGLRSVLVSCGFMREDPLKEMCETLDAIKIDLKGYSEEFYRKVSSAELKPVLRSIQQIAKSKVHLEIVNLVVPTLNDSDKMLKELVDWIAGELGPDVPIHFTKFHPDYQLLNLPPTPVATLDKARRLAMEKGIRYAFVGNDPDNPGNHTYCPSCKKIVIQRSGFLVIEMHLKGGACGFCGQKIAGVWS
jgi:pyruvate formate lyase activating enzyme